MEVSDYSSQLRTLATFVLGISLKQQCKAAVLVLKRCVDLFDAAVSAQHTGTFTVDERRIE